MATVRGYEGIYTRRTARRDYRCDGPHGTYAADPIIHAGDDYFRAALPPHSDLGNLGWWTQRLCWTCAPVDLTTTVRAEAQR